MSIKAWMDGGGKLIWNGPIRAIEPVLYKRPAPSHWKRLRARLHDARIWLKKTFRPRAFWRDLSHQLARQEQINCLLDIIETRDVF